MGLADGTAHFSDYGRGLGPVSAEAGVVSAGDNGGRGGVGQSVCADAVDYGGDFHGGAAGAGVGDCAAAEGVGRGGETGGRVAGVCLDGGDGDFVCG